ncbi:PadR family transcriptional regulator [Paenibacillus wynnii]|uniref:PadR family transcriptional regulator n=1 Tax=Paenibacillus wynnii TaxID=268407 RepID=UPI002792F7EB|nr:helix-turn-helix transcriptional regulator [Paenibacillus wynnii]MDQ0194340.1 DNA-binding PadR family transcriptional regulator [Paenibacillus wynnii]
MSRNNSMVTDQLTDSAYYILLSLLVPRHGYAIMKYIEELTEGEVIMGPATLYTLIKKMVAADYITAGDVEDDRRKPYGVTKKGKQIIDNEIERRSRMVRHGMNAIQQAKEVSDHEKK